MCIIYHFQTIQSKTSFRDVTKIKSGLSLWNSLFLLLISTKFCCLFGKKAAGCSNVLHINKKQNTFHCFVISITVLFPSGWLSSPMWCKVCELKQYNCALFYFFFIFDNVPQTQTCITGKEKQTQTKRIFHYCVLKLIRTIPYGILFQKDSLFGYKSILPEITEP